MCDSNLETKILFFLRCSTTKETMSKLGLRWTILPNLVSLSSLENLILGSLNPMFSPLEVAKFETVIRAFLCVL